MTDLTHQRLAAADRVRAMKTLALLKRSKLSLMRKAHNTVEADLSFAWLEEKAIEEFQEFRDSLGLLPESLYGKHGMIAEIVDVINTLEILYRNCWRKLSEDEKLMLEIYYKELVLQ